MATKARATRALATTPVAIVGDRYELSEVLGHGGMGDIRAGWDRRLSRAVAVKILKPELAGNPTVRARFDSEARMAAALAHPHVVPVYDVGDDDGVPYIVMERLSGKTLANEMADGPLDGERVRSVAGQVLSALGAAHDLGIVHRDLKPGNVLIHHNGDIKVADFGIAKAADAADLTAVTELVGTVAYLAPERLEGKPATASSDLYSLGVLLYEAIGGRKPFGGDSPISIAYAACHTKPEPLRSLRPDVDHGLATAIERALCPDPKDRFQSAAQMWEALERSATDVDATQPIDATRLLDLGDATVRLARPVPAARRRWRPSVPVVAAGAVSLLVAVLVAALLSGGDGRLPVTPAQNVPAERSVAPATPGGLGDALDRLEQAVRP